MAKTRLFFHEEINVTVFSRFPQAFAEAATVWSKKK
jgi:hypothetical protein